MRFSGTHTEHVTVDAAAARAIRRRLLAWFDRHARDLPWRRRSEDPYAQLLAELMLHQTQVVTVVPYYERFIARFPTVNALAAGDLDEILAMWSGLGYYRRARHLHAAAQKIVADFGGQVPRTVEALMTLPGVGRYTAGAVASIAFDVRAPILDGNVMRVLARLFADAGDPASPKVQRRMWARAEALLPHRRCGAFNQALMDLGGAPCVPVGPNCPACPLAPHCAARTKGLTERIPPVRRRAKVQATEVTVAALRYGERLLFVQRPADGLWAGLWELPTEPVGNGESPADARARLRKRLPRGTRLATQANHLVTRLLSHRRVTFHVFEGHLGSGGAPGAIGDGEGSRWAARNELGRLGVSRACTAILARIGWLKQH